MCGIAGSVGASSAGHDAAVARMTQAQRHRGPEGTIYGSLGDAAFGFCRLAFVEIGIASQPWRTRDDALLVVFNGEIYNHRELRGGVAVETARGEAPLIAALYQRQGVDFVKCLNGMFAIAIYDRPRRELLLFRDRFGKKPLYYFNRAGRSAFASELTALSLHPDCPTEVDAESVAQFLTFHAVPAPRAIYRGVRKVPAGGVVRLRDGEEEVSLHWRPRLSVTKMPLAERVEHTDLLLTAAVLRRFSDEAPFGIFLSGGVDSSLIAAIAARHAGAPLASFSIGFPGTPTFDESAHASRAAELLGLRHHVVPLSLARLTQTSMDTLARVDEPLADPALVSTAALAEEARRNVKAVLTGDGADELLMGYRFFVAERALGMLRKVLPLPLVTSALNALARGAASDRNLHFRHVARLLVRSLACPPAHRYHEAAAAFPPADWPSILSDEARSATASDPYRELDRAVSESGAATNFERLQIGMIAHFLRDGILAKLDRATMQWGLEARSPFLDRDLVDFLFALPQDCKLRGFTTKFLLKQVAVRYLPAAIVERRKQGFRSPVSAMLRGPMREFLCDRLSDRALAAHGLFQLPRVRQLLDEHFRRTEDHHRRLWPLLCFQCWWEAMRERRLAPADEVLSQL
jgi:asparagine synthase (glutamine-hydrolysing)